MDVLDISLAIINTVIAILTFYNERKEKKHADESISPIQNQQNATIQSGENSNNQIIQIDNSIITQEILREKEVEKHQKRVESFSNLFRFTFIITFIISVGINLPPLLTKDLYINLQFLTNDVLPFLIAIINTNAFIICSFTLTLSLIGLCAFLLPFSPKRSFDSSKFRNFTKKGVLLLTFSCSLVASLLYVFNKNKIDTYEIVQSLFANNNQFTLISMLFLLGSVSIIFYYFIQILLAYNRLDTKTIFLLFITSLVFLCSTIYISLGFSIAF